MSLLDKAKKVQPSLGRRPSLKDFNQEHYQLLVAYMNRQVTQVQVASVLGIHPQNVDRTMMAILRDGLVSKQIDLRIKEKQ